MKTSKYLKIDQNLRHSKWHYVRIQKNRGPKDLYILCTCPHSQNLFEIITCDQLTCKHEDSYALGLSKDKTWLIAYVVELIDYIMADTKDNINTARRSHWSSYLPIVSAPFYTA